VRPRLDDELISFFLFDCIFFLLARLVGLGFGNINLTPLTEPDRQFAMIADHIRRLRLARPHWNASPIRIYVERNLGFEAEHHKLALQHLPGVSFRMDPGSNRVGVYTTQTIKHAMATLMNTMLRDNRVHVLYPLVTEEASNIVRLREQLNVYSYQFKIGVTTFQPDRCAISGKIGGMKDDICIALQLGLYFTDIDIAQGNR
jgi:hypothetical protein